MNESEVDDMRKNTLLVTGSSGLIGSAVVENLQRDFERIYGLDNNMRAVFFGDQGDSGCAHYDPVWLNLPGQSLTWSVP